MESYIQISKLNDFIFCPRSLYFHSLYDNFAYTTFHRQPQIAGKIVHEAIDKGFYSSAKRYMQGLEVWSERYGLAGKIDVYDVQEKMLIERKNKVKVIYDGYRYQLYAQMFCLQEMGYQIDALRIHSLTDNKRYSVPMPEADDVYEFEKLIDSIRDFDISKSHILVNSAKCAECVYKPLCH